MDKFALIDKIKKIEGLDNDERAALVEMLNTQKKYGLVWEDKPEAVEERLRTELPVLKEVTERAIISDSPEAPNHILIEGDNLEALTALTYTHEGKIDVIYIDPPYNTGNKDFVYNDSFVDHEDTYRHSKWLSFMNKRLKIAKQLLSDKGVIFISIDDNEQAQLKMLCDEVFGENNYIGSLPRVTKKSGKDHGDYIAKNHDYIIIYVTNIVNNEFKGVEVNVEGFDKSDEFVGTRGKYKLNQTLDYDSLWYNPAMDFPIEIDGRFYYPGGNKEAHDARHMGIHNPKDWVWRWSKAKFEFGYNNGFVVLKKGKERTRIYTKTYLNASIEKDDQSYRIAYSDRKSNISSLAFTENEYSNDNAKKEMGAVINANVFDFPKPYSMILQLIDLINSNNVIILDFFAGSGTTLHATMQLNAEDGGHRKCILVTNNENNICEEVTYVRNKRVIEGYTTPKGEEVAGLKANSLRYYRTELLPRRKTVKNKRLLMAAATELLCIKHDIYKEVAMLGDRELDSRAARYFDNGRERVLIIYKEETVDSVVETLRAMDVEGKIKIYVFSMNRYAYEDNFEEVADKVELCALPAAIYNAYKQVLPKEEDND